MVSDFQLAVRLPEDEQLLQGRSDDPALTPDRVSPAIEGYFRIPAIWVGEAPDPLTVRRLNPEVHHEIILRRTMRCGIEIRVQRDGMFWFDFAKWPLAPQVTIPGYRILDPGKPYRPPPASQKAEELAESFAVLRAQVMNVHQAAFTSSESIVKRRSAGMGFPVTAWSTDKAISWRGLHSYHDDVEDLHALGRNILNNSHGVNRTRPLGRRVIETEVVEHSIDLLDGVLAKSDVAVIQMVEALYMAACRNRDKRFGEALTLAWSVCEQAIFAKWRGHIDSLRSPVDATRMPKDRKEKLLGRDYTSSVVLETLEFLGILDGETYRMLDICRRARNKWAHQLRTPKESESQLCVRTAQKLIGQTFGIPLHLQQGGRGGVPQWPLWMWAEVAASEGR